MEITLLKAKLHKAVVTHSELEYEGSCAIDGRLLETAGILEYEQIQIYNLANGERFTTYAIRAEDAHKARPGDRVIICAYARMTPAEAAGFRPRLVYLDENNRIRRTGDHIPVQVA